MIDALLLAQVLIEKVAKRASGPAKIVASVALVPVLAVLVSTGSHAAVLGGLGLIFVWILFVSLVPGK